MNTQREAELKMVLAQLETLSDRLEELRDEEAREGAALPKKSQERKVSQELCDCMDDAQDSIVDAIRALEDLLEEE